MKFIFLFALSFIGCMQIAQAADDYLFKGFITPSGNIACYLEPDSQSLICEIEQTVWNPERKLIDCPDLDVGKQLVMAQRGKPQGGWWCRGDTWIHPGIKNLTYGETWRADGFTCIVSKENLRCRNLDGHGWTMARKAVEIF